jgi:hypothetical protein
MLMTHRYVVFECHERQNPQTGLWDGFGFREVAKTRDKGEARSLADRLAAGNRTRAFVCWDENGFSRKRVGWYVSIHREWPGARMFPFKDDEFDERGLLTTYVHSRPKLGEFAMPAPVSRRQLLREERAWTVPPHHVWVLEPVDLDPQEWGPEDYDAEVVTFERMEPRFHSAHPTEEEAHEAAREVADQYATRAWVSSPQEEFMQPEDPRYLPRVVVTFRDWDGPREKMRFDQDDLHVEHLGGRQVTFRDLGAGWVPFTYTPGSTKGMWLDFPIHPDDRDLSSAPPTTEEPVNEPDVESGDPWTPRDPAARLRQLEEFREKGLIADSEYTQMRAAILADI